MALFLHNNKTLTPIGGGEQELKNEMKLIKEEINLLKSTLDTKLDSDKITNNNDITESGWAIDAQQANANISGTISNKILNIEENLVSWKNESTTIETEAYKDMYIPLDLLQDTGFLEISMSVSQECKYFYITNGKESIRQCGIGARNVHGILTLYSGRACNIVVQTEKNASVGVSWSYKLKRNMV